MKKTIILSIICTLLFAAGMQAGSLYGRYKKIVKKSHIGQIEEYWSEDLTFDILEKRQHTGTIIVEKIIGTVIDKKKNGKIMGAEAGHDYISYKRVKGAKKGDTILTICIYNPDNGYCDDILERFDYIIDRRK